MTSRRLISLFSRIYRYILRLALVVVIASNVFAGAEFKSPPRSVTGQFQTNAEDARDYLLPAELAPDKGVVRETAKGTPARHGQRLSTSSVLSPHQITYTSFHGDTFQLTAYDGLHVRYAFPQEWLGSGGFSEAEIARLLDLTDILYEHMREVVRGEPLDAQDAGSLLTIAIVPTVSSIGQPVSGLGQIGRKGIEIDPKGLASLKLNLSQGLVTELVIHEMSHNFDLYDAWLTYGHDWPHAWTNFLIPYMQYYSRSGSLQWDADALFEKTLLDYLGPWRSAGAASTWDVCVRDQQCPGIRPNDVWAGFLLTYAKFHGPDALKRAMDYLKAYKVEHPVPAATADENNDLLIEALASGSGVNIAHDADWLRWKVSAGEGAGLASRFTVPSPYSLDRDGDTFTPLGGDTDDADANVHPGAVEVQNGRDDDCNGLVDERVIRESGDFPSFAWEQTVTLSAPARLVGTHNSDQDLDAVRLDVPVPRFVRFTLKTSLSANVTLDIRHQSEQGQITQISGSGVMSKTVFLDRPGTWWLQVSAQPGATFGPYEVLVNSADSTANPIALSVADGAAANTLSITAKTDLQRKFLATPSHIRFWARGVGFIKELPVGGTVSFDWTPPGGDIDSLMRAQLLSSGTPVSPITEAVSRSSARSPDVAVRPMVSFPTAVNNLETIEFKFEVLNKGEAEASGVFVNFTLPQGMTLAGATADRGQVITSGNSGVLILGAMTPSEAITLTVRATGWGLAGTFVSGASANSSGADGDSTNNTAELSVTLQEPQAPSSLEQKVYRLPLRPAGSQGPEVLAQGALARVVVPASGLNLQQPVYATGDPSIAWPTSLAGLEVSVAGQPAVILAVTTAPQAAGVEAYAVDFVVPDTVQTGTAVPIIVHHTSTSRSWDFAAQIQDSAPALWTAGGLSQGQAIAQNADDYTALDSSFPAPADGKSRVAIYATGIRKLADRGGLTVRARTASGVETLLPIEYAGPQGHLPGLNQLILRIPTTLAGSGQIPITIDSALDSAVLLQIK